MKKIYESFQWLRHFELTNPKGKWVRFKGVALYPTISGNQRKYVEEELIRAARTLVGKPITVNHNPNHIIGNVEWAEHEDGRTEYIGQIDSRKSPEYADKIRDMFNLNKSEYITKWAKDPIYGVSVEAKYLYHNEDCVDGLCNVEPHGILYDALSVVEDPEKPGVADTTMELMEMKLRERSVEETQVMSLLLKDLVSWHNMPNSLFESYNTNVVHKIEENKMRQSKGKTKVKKSAAVSHEKVIAHLPISNDPRAQLLMEQADTGAHDCAENEHWDEEQKKCVPNETATEQEEAPSPPCPEGWHEVEGKCVKDEAQASEQKECPEGQVRNPETGECEPKASEQEEACPEGMHKDETGQCVPDQPPKTASVPEFPEKTSVPMLAPETPSAFTEFGGTQYSSHADCVSKNQDKSDPDAYCAEISRKSHGEALLLKKLDELGREIKGLKKSRDTVALEAKHKEAEVKEALRTIEAQLKQLGFKFESISRNVGRNRLQRNSDIKIVKEQFSKQASWNRNREALDGRQCKSIGELKKTQGTMDKNFKVLGGVAKKTVQVVSNLNETLSTKAGASQLEALHTMVHSELAKVTGQFKAIGDSAKNLEQLERRFQEYKHNQQKTVKETLNTDATVQKLTKTIQEQQGQIDTLKKHFPPNFKAGQKPPEQEEDTSLVTEPYT